MATDMHILRFYDGFDNEWMDISIPVHLEEAQRLFDEHTDNGKKNTSYRDIDYYRIFPADTTMLYGSK